MQTLGEKRILKEFARVHENRDTWVWVIVMALGVILGLLW
jgi:hypothetical protein